MTTTPRSTPTDFTADGRESTWPWAHGSPQLPLDITAATVASAAATVRRPVPFRRAAEPATRPAAGRRVRAGARAADRPPTPRRAAPRLRSVAAPAAERAGRRTGDTRGADRARSAPRATSWTALVELVRAPAALTVPGDVLVGAATSGRRLGPRVAALAGASVALYWAGMALNDWADREQDATERPERPIPSGRVPAPAALGVAVGLTAAGLGLGALGGGRRGLLLRTLPLAASVWAYDLGLKRTALGPAAMAAARALDVLHGAEDTRPAVPSAAAVALHTLALTRLSRLEVHGAAHSAEPRRALAATAALTVALAADPLAAVPAAQYAAEVVPVQLRAERSRSAADVRAAVGAGIHALLPLQAALLARAGTPRLAVPLLLARPVAGRLARKVAPT